MASLEESGSLAQQAIAGNRKAFEQLVEPHRVRLESVVASLLGNRLRQRVDVDDVLQDTLLRAYLGLKDLRWEGEAAFSRWLCAIATHVIQDLGRQHSAVKLGGLKLEVPLLSSGLGGAGAHEPAMVADGTSPSKAAIRNERFDRLSRALESLSPRHREVLLLAHIRRLPLEEVGKRLGCSKHAAGMLLVRARRELKTAFGETDSLHLPDRELGR